MSTIGKKDTVYNHSNIDIDEYLNYKLADLDGEKNEDGETITGSKKREILEYVNQNISGYENRLMIIGKKYKLNRSQQQDLANYINTLDDADEVFKDYSYNFKVSNDGTVYYK